MEMWLRTQKGVDDGSSMACGTGVKICNVIITLLVWLYLCVGFDFID